MRTLELFSGSKTFSGLAKELGCVTLTVDKFIDSDLQIGIESLTREMIVEKLGGEPDAIWASPVCSAWSKTGWYHHWDTVFYSRTKRFKPASQFAIESVEMVRKTIEIFSWFPDAVFWMENPEGMLQRHPVINNFIRYNIPVQRHYVTYCQYGDSVMKPTHIWTNSTTWKPRKPCSNGSSCHMPSPRGSMKGMYSKGDSFERSKIPTELCKEVLTTIQ